MKKHLFSVCCTVLAIGSILSACTEGDPVYLEPEETQAAIELSSTDSQVSVNSGKTQATAIIGYAGGDIEITVASTLDSWSIQDVTDENERFTITQNKNVLKISAPENNSPDDSYSASVTVVTGKGGNKATALITVTQSSATPTIYCTIGDGGVAYDSENKILTIELENGSKILENIVITSNFGGWVFNEDIDGIDWITFEKDISWMVLHIPQNMTFVNRNASFTLTIGEGDQAETITVNVSQPKLIASLAISGVTGTDITVAADGKSASRNDLKSAGGSFVFTISSAGDWTYALSDPNTKVSTITKSGSTLTWNVLPNGYDTRSLTLTISSGIEGNSDQIVISVNQSSYTDDYGEDAKAPMILEITTTTENEKVMLPLYGEGINCKINWGDSSELEVYTATNPNSATAANHTYAEPGVYQVNIGGKVPALDCQSTGVVTGSTDSKTITGVVDWGEVGLTSMERAFLNCKGLKYLPAEDTNAALKNVTTFYYGFRNTGLTSIPKDTFKYAATEINNCNFSHAFSLCASLTEIDGDAFANCSKITTFTNAFQGCTALESIPENLFAGMTGVMSFSYTFGDCTSLGSVPENLFASNTAVTNFSYMFNGCTALESVPENLFASNTAVTNFSYMFIGCKALESVPENLFASNTAVIDFSNLFNGCDALESVPENLFASNTAVTNFSNTFRGCKALESIPENLFASNVKATLFTYAFTDCSALESIPANLFASNVNATMFSFTFQNCTSLEELPVGLFENNIKITSVNYLFAGCTGLTTIPTSIFDKNTGINNFSNTFNGCIAWEGESPYYSGVEPKIPLYKRAIGDEGGTSAVPFSSANCFAGCSKLTDYASIPSAWGGGGQ